MSVRGGRAGTPPNPRLSDAAAPRRGPGRIRPRARCRGSQTTPQRLLLRVGSMRPGCAMSVPDHRGRPTGTDLQTFDRILSLQATAFQAARGCEIDRRISAPAGLATDQRALAVGGVNGPRLEREFPEFEPRSCRCGAIVAGCRVETVRKRPGAGRALRHEAEPRQSAPNRMFRSLQRHRS